MITEGGAEYYYIQTLEWFRWIHWHCNKINFVFLPYKSSLLRWLQYRILHVNIVNGYFLLVRSCELYTSSLESHYIHRTRGSLKYRSLFWTAANEKMYRIHEITNYYSITSLMCLVMYHLPYRRRRAACLTREISSFYGHVTRRKQYSNILDPIPWAHTYNV